MSFIILYLFLGMVLDPSASSSNGSRCSCFFLFFERDPAAYKDRAFMRQLKIPAVLLKIDFY